MAYQFALNINDEINSLSPKNGLGVDILWELLKNLYKAITAKDGQKVTMYQVTNHGYTPHFITESQKIYNNFLEVHNNIFEKGVGDLTKNETEYAVFLKKILSVDKYLEPLDTKSKPLFKLTSPDIDKTVETYNSITTQSGIISEIGAPKISQKSHIYLNDVSYKIFISSAQEKILTKHYKKAIVELRVNQKKSIKTGRVINAELLSIKEKSSLNFTESMATLTKRDLSFMKNIKTNEDLIRFIES